MLNKLRASKGKGFDIVFPSVSSLQSWYDASAEDGAELLQPVDESRVKADQVQSAIWERSLDLGASRRGKRYGIPFNWGTEGVAFNSEVHNLTYENASWNSQWEKGNEGKVAVRPRSGLTTIALMLDGTGQMLDEAYRDEAMAKKVFDQALAFAIEHKPWVKVFWKTAADLTDAFTQNGCTIGQSWDGTAIGIPPGIPCAEEAFRPALISTRSTPAEAPAIERNSASWSLGQLLQQAGAHVGKGVGKLLELGAGLLQVAASQTDLCFEEPCIVVVTRQLLLDRCQVFPCFFRITVAQPDSAQQQVRVGVLGPARQMVLAPITGFDLAPERQQRIGKLERGKGVVGEARCGLRQNFQRLFGAAALANHQPEVIGNLRTPRIAPAQQSQLPFSLLPIL